ncbi:hypothetical protein ACQ4PT_049017 [Festuca glaucescens]
MEEDQSAVLVAEGAIKSIKLSLSTEAEICTYSINDCPVTHPSQLGNPFLGLPLESGKCESCGASENGKCEGHFGYIELPVPIYHPCHVSELRQLLTLVCLKCRRMKKAKGKQSNGKENVSVTACHYADCRVLVNPIPLKPSEFDLGLYLVQALPALSVKETKTADGAFRLELKAPPKKHMTERSWNFLDQYGFHYGGASHNRILLPEEALNILKKIPDETKKKLAARGYIAQSGYVMKYLPVPPNCLYIPEFTDGQSIMSYDISISLLKKILQKIEQIKKSRAGPPNFESHDVESSDLQLSIGQYIQLRGTTKGPQDAKRYAISTDSSHLSTKQWLDKMRTLFISKGPPSTHKHSLQAFKSLAAKAEALELFSVEKQLTNSHNGKINLQLANDSLLALKHMSSRTMLSKESANQLAMLLSLSLPAPALVKSKPYWTISQILQSALPAELTCEGDRFLVKDSTVVKLDLAKESVQASFSDLVSSINCVKGPGDALKFLNALQPLLMEFLLLDGFSVSLQDFSVPKILLEEAQESIKKQSAVLEQSRSSKGQFVEMRVDNNLKDVKQQISDFVVKSSHLGLLIDPKSDPSVSKVVQQLGFVGLQLYREGKFYSSRLVEDCFSNFVNRHPPVGNEVQHPPEAYGLVQSSYFHGLNPYEELVHAISTRETIVRSSRGLTEPGTLFKSLMAILRDVVVCYDGTVRNICSNSIMQLKYKEDDATDFPSDITPGEPVGVLAATAISNPAYKAVLDASQSNNTSWELMKEILQTKVNYKNDTKDRKVILFLNDCSCPKKFCKEKAAIAVQGCLKKVTLEDCATDICIEYQKQTSLDGISEATPAFVGHIHLQKAHLETINISTEDILHKCQEVSVKHGMKKGHLAHLFKKITFSTCMTCTGNLNGFNNAGYKATFRSLKVQVPFTESTLFTPMKCFEKAAEKCHSDSLGCVVSSCSWGKHAALGTGSSFEILWNENQLKSNKEYGDGLYDFLALVRTDQEKARYTFLDDVDYLVEDNACLSPELDATFEDCLEEQDTEKGGSWDNDRTANANWDQNASAGNDSENWGGWSNATAAADTGAAKPADQGIQGIASWNVPATVENDSADWGGWGTEKVKDKKTVPEEPAGLDTWADQSAKKDTDAHNGSWGSVAAKTRTCTAEDVPWGCTQTSSAEHMDAQNDSWENVAAKAASLSDNAWNAAPVSQGNENSEAKEPDAWDGWGSAQAKDSSADDLNKSDASNNSKGWKSDGWAAKESRRDQRDNLGRPPMRPVERPPRPRFELPADAKKILHEIEPIVLSVRKIFRESCDGVNLSLEDEKFIKEKILEHHPEKDKKLSSETDHIVVNKHHTFQESRCFYVVSSDGTQIDFSYIKCLDNYVRKSYAEEPAELVSQMYFQRRNRDRAPAEASQPTPAETSQLTPQEAQLETPAPLAGTASQEALASPSATQQETPVATPRETPAATETAPVATPQETLAATETVNKWAEKPDSDSAWGAGASDDKWA